MRATRTVLAAAIAATTALGAPAVASGGCAGPHYAEVDSLRIHVGAPTVRHGVAEVPVRVTRVGSPGAGVADAHVAVGRIVGGTPRFGRAVTRDDGAVVVRLDRTSPSRSWHRRATASRQTVEAAGCTPGVIETGQST